MNGMLFSNLLKNITDHQCRYHSKCLKIARGKVREEDDYTCPICDYRVKIPRDAARPKIEDLSEWRQELEDLPFQPEEEQLLNQIMDTALAFRRFIRHLVNPMLSSPEELNTQRFYLRKIEGAEVLLTYETNFFRQEVHKWVQVAPEPPPRLEQSLSTRKPRPTKQQRLMQQHNVSTPEELPLQFRRKEYNINKAKRQSSGHQARLAAAPAKRPRSSQSTPSSASGDPSHRFPPNISTADANQHYGGGPYPLSAGSPYFNHSGHNPHSPFTESPRYGQSRSPLSATYPMDPNMESPFGSGDHGHPHGRMTARSPHHRHTYSNSSNSTSQNQDPAEGDDMFDEFVDHGGDEDDEDVNAHADEVAKALEERDREQEEEEANGRDDIEDFVQES